MSAPRLILLPGLGADGRLFGPQAAEFGGLEVRDWLSPREEEDLESYGRRMADAVRPSGEYVVGGVSFGGMVAMEMARHLRPRALLLIASATTGRVIRGHRRLVVGSGLRLGVFARRPPRVVWPALRWAFGATTPEARRLLAHFLADASPSFVQWGLQALRRWQPADAPLIPLIHIHGSADRLIPAGRVKATHVVPGAGHLVNVTHAGEVNAIIRRVLHRE